MKITPLPDRIENEILIEASLDRVWELVSTPGWWINDGSIAKHKISQVGNQVVLIDPVHGQFTLQILETRLQKLVRYAWACEGDAAPAPITTEVCFTLGKEGENTLLKVVESGFAAASDPERAYRLFQENKAGWQQELKLLKAELEQLK